VIPKVIHCCWLGDKPKTRLVKTCQESWRKFAPDWTVREWTMVEIQKASASGRLPQPPKFFYDAVKSRKWAFAADWLRFAALMSEGGIYLDCDVELLKPLTANKEFVAGQWMPNGNVGLEPAVLALEKNSAIARAMVEFYDSASFDANRTTGEIMEEILVRVGLSIEVRPPEVFCPIDINGRCRKTENTVGIHHYAMSWVSGRRKLAQWLSWHGMRPLVDMLLQLRHKIRQSSPMARLVAVAALIITAISVVQGFRNGLDCVDFHWESAALFLKGENPYQWFFDGRFYEGVIVDATQAPSTIAFILPFGLLPHSVANSLWAVCNLGFTAMFLFFMYRLFFAHGGMVKMFGVFAVMFLCGVPWRVGMGCGQHTIFSLAFFAAAVWAMHRERSWIIVGTLISASLFKYTVTAPLALLFIIHRQWKAIGLAAAIHAALTVMLGLWTGTNPIDLLLQSVKVGTALNPAGGDADLAGIARWFGAENFRPWALAGYAIFGLVLAAYTAIRLHQGRGNDIRKLSMDLATLALLANLVCYHRSYDFVTLAFPLAACLVRLHKPCQTVLAAILALPVINTFFFLRIDFALGLDVYRPIGFALHLLALLTCVSSHEATSTREGVCKTA